MLPKEVGFGSGSTCWRRLRDWQEAGVWEELHWVLLNRLGETDRDGSSFETSVEISLEGLAGGRTLMRVVEVGFPNAGERDFHLSGLPTAFERVARFVHERFTEA